MRRSVEGVARAWIRLVEPPLSFRGGHSHYDRLHTDAEEVPRIGEGRSALVIGATIPTMNHGEFTGICVPLETSSPPSITDHGTWVAG